MYSINFSVSKNKFCLSLHYNGANSYLFVNGIEVIRFKVNDGWIVENSLCVGNILEKFSAANMKRQDYMDLFMILVLMVMLLKLMIYLDIHKYLMEKNNII